MSDDDHDDYEVGYGKPPKDTQFKPGQSGNPKGRPKGTQNFKTDLKEVLSDPVQITQGGKTITVTKQQALIMRSTAEGLKGNQRATALIFKHAEQLDEDEASDDKPLDADDQKILDRYTAKRIQLMQIKDEDES